LKKYFAMLVLVSFVLIGATMVSAADLTGVWRYTNQSEEGVEVFSQDGEKIISVGYHSLNGVPAAVIGQSIGTVKGNVYTRRCKVTRRPNPTWGGRSGITDQEFTISPDNKSIQGTWKNDAGQGNVSMIRVH
jgi:hypothetical protein